MLNFDFYSPTRILFGKDTHKNIGTLLKPHAKKILLHYGGGSIKKTGLYDSVTSSLKENGIEYVELSGVQPNPRISLAYEGIEICKKENVELILAVGGGSSIDSSKTIAMGVCNKDDIWDIIINRKPIERALPVAAILTIPAAGSEISGDAVMTNKEKNKKLGYSSPHLRPLSAIYDLAHGASLAILAPAWMRYVYKDNINMFVQFAVNVMGVKDSYRAPDAVVLEGIARLEEFFSKLELPATLSEAGIDDSKFEMMAKIATDEEDGRINAIGGLKKLYWKDVVEIYKTVR